MFYVSDTHALIYYFADRLPEKAARIFTGSEEGKYIIYIPTIVLTELVYLVENGKVSLNLDTTLSAIERSRNFYIADFDYDVFTLFRALSIPEIHDRIIVSTAKHLDATIITQDVEIGDSEEVETIWE